MKVNKIQFNNLYLERTSQVQKQKLKEQTYTKITNTSINSNEVKFFQKLFPASAQQIESYIYLNKNRKIVETNLNKGSILDTKI